MIICQQLFIIFYIFLFFRLFHPIKSVVFLPSSAPTLKTFNVSDAATINLAITLNSVWCYFVPYVSFAITAAPFAISHNHSPFAGCWSHSKKLPCIGFVANSRSTSANSSSLIARMRSAFVGTGI